MGGGAFVLLKCADILAGLNYVISHREATAGIFAQSGSNLLHIRVKRLVCLFLNSR